MVLILMRHTRPKITEGTCYGHLDIGVASDFEAEATVCLAKIRQPQRIVCSPLERCTRLAKRAAEFFNLDYSLEPDLIEMNFGRWEGVLWADIPRRELDQWADDFLDAAPHGGESVRDLKTRVEPVLHALAESHDTTLAITHAGVIKVAAALQGQKTAWETSTAYGNFFSYGD